MGERLRIGVPRESRDAERRVAVVPDLIRSLCHDGKVEVLVGTGAGKATGYTDEDFESAGAEIVWGEEVWRADLLLCANAPSPESISRLTESGRRRVVIGRLDPWADAETIKLLADAGVTAFSIEAAAKTQRTMDGNSVRGYAAMMMAARESFSIFSMIVGDGPPARVLVLGGGPSCQQALAAARRLGAIAIGWDADESEDMVREWVAERAADLDVLITDVETPGRSTPFLISRETVAAMAPGSVVIDCGGNCEVTRTGETIIEAGVSVLGPVDLSAEIPVPASMLYAQSIESLVGMLVDSDGELDFDLSHDILGAACVTDAGAVRRRTAVGTGDS